MQKFPSLTAETPRVLLNTESTAKLLENLRLPRAGISMLSRVYRSTMHMVEELLVITPGRYSLLTCLSCLPHLGLEK